MNMFIYGAGGLGLEVADIARRQADMRHNEPGLTLYFIDDFDHDRWVDGHRVISLDDAVKMGGGPVAIGVGEPAARATLARRVEEAGLPMTAVVDPSAIISPTATLHPGAIVCPFVSVSSHAHLGANAVVNTGSIVGHHCSVGENAVLSSQVNLGGGARIGSGAFIGMGALIKESVTIGAETIVSMGSCVHRDMPEAVIAVGAPARIAKRNEANRVFKARPPQDADQPVRNSA